MEIPRHALQPGRALGSDSCTNGSSTGSSGPVLEVVMQAVNRFRAE
ncbi:hypothetical protein ACH4GK_11020 [Streptomyces rimosus]|nr:hypothetical protein [Streptomyces rimosus]